MTNLCLVARIEESLVDRVDDAHALIDLAQQDTAAVGGDFAPVEGGYDGLGFQVCEGELGVTDGVQWAHLAMYVFPSQINILEGSRCFVRAPL